MASRSMRYFRRHSKVIMATMGVVCIITWGIFGTFGGGSKEPERNPVAVTWVKGKVREQELSSLRDRNKYAYRFLATVIVTCIQRGGKPTVNGAAVNIDARGVPDRVGIAPDDDDEATVRKMVLAEEARRMGIVVDRAAVKDFLKQISASELQEGDWLEIARDVIGERGGITVEQLFEHLAYELRAQHASTLAMTALYAQRVGVIVPPGEAWDLFNRLNRRLAIEAYPVDVDSLKSEVKAEPSPAELQGLFDRGKYRDPNPDLDEPAFHKPHKLAFTYLRVDFNPYLEEAKKQITEEQIEERYKQDISQGRHKVLDLPSATPPETKNEPDQPGEEKKDENKPADEKKEEKPAAANPADNKGEAKPADAQKPTDKGADQPECGGCADEPPREQRKEKQADEKPAEAKPVETKPDVAKPDETKPADAKPEENKIGEAKADETKPAENKPAPEPKFKPLSEVREEILKELAQPIAREARDKAVKEASDAIEKYGKAYRRYQNVKEFKKGSAAQDPGTLDIQALAAKYGFTVGTTPLVDRFDVGNYEIGQKAQRIDFEAWQVTRQFRMMSFAEMAFLEDQPLYRPDEATSSEPDINYIYYRTAEEKPAAVTLQEVRPQLIDFWKRQKAFELALADAKKLAEKAKTAASLVDIVGGAEKVLTPPAFSWMTTGAIGFGQQPELSRPVGIDLAGREFMEAVFALAPNECGVAPNQSHAKVYVVRVQSQTPSDDVLRNQFLESGYNQITISLATEEVFYTRMQWIREIEQQYQVKWQRPPRENNRRSM